jgi:plastocyanin
MRCLRSRSRLTLVRRNLVGAVAAAFLLVLSVPAGAMVPLPDPSFIEQIPGDACTPTTSYEKATWAKNASAQAGKACKRMHFAFGPIVVKPGQNDVLIGPVTIEKPAYDGYITRFRPDLVDQTGKPPDITIVHLHHSVWLNAGNAYGNGPFFAAGEEKTIMNMPRGYGMHVGANDKWLLLYMVHSATPRPATVWITYDIDFVPDAAAKSAGIVPVKPVWLDVQHQRIAPGAPSTSGNPVFNVQKGFGHFDKETGQRVCTWPKENCARHDVYGDVTPQQGRPIKLPGADWQVPRGMAGTLVMIGGHLHPGGIRDEVSLVRKGVEKPIYISDAVYWSRDNESRAGGPRTSWDFSMGFSGAPFDWKVKIKPGDVIRLNAVYDSEHASWYENMGIVMAFVAPNDPHAPAGVDVFDDNVKLDRGVPKSAKAVSGWKASSCAPDLTGRSKTLCLRGALTHGHLDEASTFGGCNGCTALPKVKGPELTNVTIGGFTYGLADLGLAEQSGVAQVKVGKPVRFWNVDTAYDAWHTITRCKAPCTGQTGLDYPVADGGTGKGDGMDFDSTEVGYGIFFSPASGRIGADKPLDEAIRDGMYWDFTPKNTGVYTFFCRVHPSMRGAIDVVK